MRLKEIFESFEHKDVGVSDGYLNNPEEIDRRFNREIWYFNQKQRKNYDPNSTTTNVIKKYDDSQDPKFTNQPKSKDNSSAGFKGLEFTKNFIEKSKKKDEPFDNSNGEESPLSHPDNSKRLNESTEKLQALANQLQRYLKQEHPTSKLPVIIDGNNLKIETKSISWNDIRGWEFFLEECFNWIKSQPGVTSCSGSHYANMPREYGDYIPWLELTPKFAVTSRQY